jgi:hypothetical protein
MSAIPLHLQRKFEQRWAARFAPPVASAAPKSTDLKGAVNDVPRPAKQNSPSIAAIVEGLCDEKASSFN